MSFEPKPGQKILLNRESIEFISLESSRPATLFVYAEAGKEGIIYKVLKGKDHFALKVFYPDYQDKRLLKNAEKLSQFKHLEGFRVADRSVIHHKSFPEVVNKYPELNYSVLMPWIQGTIWGNLMNERPLHREKYFQIAQGLMRAVHNLENQGLAHCDLSNNNFIIDPTLSKIELIDIENMFAPDMPRPIPDISYGTIGYRTKWISENGLWGSNSDRFASAILCSEIITWHNKEIRDNKAGETSFFDEAEIGSDSERYRLMKTYLSKINEFIPDLFEKAWLSQTPNDCPTVGNWLEMMDRNIGLELAVNGKITEDMTLNTLPGSSKEKTKMQNDNNFSNIKNGLPNRSSSTTATIYLLISFFFSGLLLSLAILILGLLVKIIPILTLKPGLIINVGNFIISIIYTSTLTILTGIIQLIIFKNRIKTSKLAYLFFLAISGGAGGLFSYLVLYILGWFNSEVFFPNLERPIISLIWSFIGLIIGLMCGGIIGILSSIAQNYIMKNRRYGFRWFAYSLFSWSIFYSIGLALALGLNYLIDFPFIGDAAASFFILTAHGLSLVIFLFFSPQLEFS